MVRGDKIYNDAFVHENVSESCWVRFMTSVRKCRTYSAVSQCHWLDVSFSQLHAEGGLILSPHHFTFAHEWSFYILPNSPVGPSIGRPMLLTTDHVGQSRK